MPLMGCVFVASRKIRFLAVFGGIRKLISHHKPVGRWLERQPPKGSVRILSRANRRSCIYLPCRGNLLGKRFATDRTSTAAWREQSGSKLASLLVLPGCPGAGFYSAENSEDLKI